MEQWFDGICLFLQDQLQVGEDFTANLRAETSDFVRMSHAQVRQPGTVHQMVLDLDWIHGQRHTAAQLTLTGQQEEDERRLRATVVTLRERLPLLPEDPYLLWNQTPHSSSRVVPDQLPSGPEMTSAILQAAAGLDFVGLLQRGPTHIGFGSSKGQRNWQSASSFHLSFSLYSHADKAVKGAYAGQTFDFAVLQARIAEARIALDVLQRPAKRITPGKYRAYLAPAALQEIIDLLCWGGFSTAELQTKQSPLLRLANGDRHLSPRVHLTELTAEGTAPGFQSEGFVRPDSVPLITVGQMAQTLTSPRTAKEYRVATNGASAQEAPESLDMAAGSIARADVLTTLGEGLYVNNLWYLNYSDKPACRFTGMTRFATFWVEGGEIVAPLDVMRFDDSVYHLLGTGLIGLTTERDFILDSDTYFKRSTRSLRLPGALVDGMAFTL
jgi:predicted Zn-dependent protease